MKTKNALFILVFAVTVIMFWICFGRIPESQMQHVSQTQPVPTSPPKVINSQLSSEKAKAGETPSQHATPAPIKTSPTMPYQMERVVITSEATEQVKSSNAESLKLVGGGTKTAKIIDSAGKVVLDAYPYKTIASCSVSPEGRNILVYYGNSDYEIVDSVTKSRVVLPQQPPGEKKLAFSAWHWVDDETVLGESGDELTNRNSTEGEDTIDIQGRLYLYNISRKELGEIQLPKDLGTKTFSVTQVSSDGHVHLVNEAPNAARSSDLGWFAVRSQK